MTAGATSRRQLALVHPEMPGQVESYLERRGHSWRQLERGELPHSLEDIQWYLINTDPVLWVECNLVERPENGGGRWRLFDYQKASLRYAGDVINSSAAEVGKTRELMALIAFYLVNRRGRILFVGNQDGTIEECWDELTFQVARNPWLGQQLPAEGQKLKPYRSWRAANGNRLITRPTGHDGTPLRGVHANLILGDEVAKWHEPAIFKELWRAALPGCSIRLYSVPDGLRTTRFYELKRSATPLVEQDPRETTAVPKTHEGPTTLTDRPWVLFHWTKPMMPAPFWGPDREAEAVRRYGAKDTNGFRQNVLGDDGEPEEAVFPWSRLKPILCYVPDYRCIQMTWDGSRGVADVFVGRLSPSYTLAATGDDSPVTASPWIVEREEEVPLDLFDAAAFVASVVARLPEGQYVAGGDFGGSVDQPTELLFFRLAGPQMTCVLRVQLRRFEYPVQAAVMKRLEACAVLPSYGWGLDATGVGSAAEQQFRSLIDDPEHVSGFVWNANRPHVNPDTGEPLVELKNGKPVERQVSNKEFATQLLEIDVPPGNLRLPLDPVFLSEWPSHTSRKLPSGKRAFNDKADHTIDAARAARLRRFDVEMGAGQAPPIVYAVPQGARRDSVGILESY
jgi:hypothetical protein